MSSLNNNEARAYTLLEAGIKSGTVHIAESALRELGLDITLTDEIYTQHVRPYLDYLTGYTTRDTIANPLVRLDRPSTEKWLKLRLDLPYAGFKNFKLVRESSTFFVSGSPRYLKYIVWMTRQGKWAVWFGRSSLKGFNDKVNESLIGLDTIRQVCDYLVTEIGDGTEDGRWYENHFHYAPLDLAQGLIDILDESIAEREARLESFKSAQAEAIAKLGSPSGS